MMNYSYDCKNLKYLQGFLLSLSLWLVLLDFIFPDQIGSYLIDLVLKRSPNSEVQYLVFQPSLPILASAHFLHVEFQWCPTLIHSVASIKSGIPKT